MSVEDLNYEDVDFERTGLKVVVCQARFEPLLRISYEPPIAFQEIIREMYPDLEARREAPALALRLSEGRLEPQVTLSGEAPQGEPTVWNFHTSDETWTVGLSGSSLSLETSAYTTFQEFSERFFVVFQAFQAAYPDIDHFTRLGLRFVNVFDKQQFGGDDWRPRFNPILMGIAADDHLGPSVTASVQQFTIAEDDWTITVRHGNEQGGEYRLDLDHAVAGRVPLADVADKVGAFNRRLYNIFRWAISEVMYDDMGPRPRG